MRNFDEIVQRAQNSTSAFGFEIEVLVPYLPHEKAREFLKPEVTAAAWKQQPLTREQVLGDMRSYMAFAWDKVQNHRGLSASRSVEKMQTWAWLLGAEDHDAIDWEDYAPYGAPVLAQVCRRFGFDIPTDEDTTNMIAGKPCGADYVCGCTS